MAKVEAMQVAKEIGLDGVQVSLGTFADNMHLREKNPTDLPTSRKAKQGEN